MGHEVSVEREMAAEAEAVWALVSDLTNMGDWSPENDGGTWAGDATGAAVGAVFRGRNHNGRYRWRTNVEVVECEPPNRLVFRLSVGPLGGCDWIYEIQPTATGCMVTESWVDNRTWLLKKIGRLASGVGDRATHNRAGMETTLANLAVAAEAAGAT